MSDAHEMAMRGLIDASRLRAYFASIEPLLYRFPSIDAPSFRRAVDNVVAGFGSGVQPVSDA